MKPHAMRELINELCICAIKFHNHQSLRERVAKIVKKYLFSNNVKETL